MSPIVSSGVAATFELTSFDFASLYRWLVVERSVIASAMLGASRDELLTSTEVVVSFELSILQLLGFGPALSVIECKRCW